MPIQSIFKQPKSKKKHAKKAVAESFSTNAVWTDMFQSCFLQQRSRLRELKEEWRETLTAAFEREVSYLEKKSSHKLKHMVHVLPFLKLFDTKTYVDLMLEVRKTIYGTPIHASEMCSIFMSVQSIDSSHTCFGITLYMQQVDLGRQVYFKYRNLIRKSLGLDTKVCVPLILVWFRIRCFCLNTFRWRTSSQNMWKCSVWINWIRITELASCGSFKKKRQATCSTSTLSWPDGRLSSSTT